MDENKKSIQEQLAKSVREKGTTKCPKCASLVQWEDAEQYNPDGSKDRYFWCSNDTCELHQRDVVKVSISIGFLQTFQQNFSKIGKGMIGALFGALSVWGYGYLNAEKPNDNDDPKIVVTETEKDKKITSLTASLGELEAKLKALNKGENTPTVVPVDNSKHQQLIDNLEGEIDSLEGEIKERDESIADLKTKAKSGTLKLKDMMGLGMYYSEIENGARKDVTIAKEHLFATLENAQVDDLGDKKKVIVRRLVEMRMKPLMEVEEYERLLKYIEYLPGDEQNIANAQVYWHYAFAVYHASSDSDYESYRKNKLLSLKYYLQLASIKDMVDQDKIDALKLIKEFQLQKIDPINFGSDTTIDIALEIPGNQSVIRSFLEYAKKNLVRYSNESRINITNPTPPHPKFAVLNQQENQFYNY